MPVEPQAVTESKSSEPAPLPETAMESFFGLLYSFLQAVNEGFESDRGSFRYFYSESFKLEILKSVMEFRAPEQDSTATETAVKLIDAAE